MALTSDLALISVGGGSVEAVDLQGRERWKMPVAREESVYLYAQAFAPGASTWIAATDDGWITSYQLEPVR